MQEQLYRPGGRESASGRRRSAGGQAPRRQMNLKEAIRPARTVSGAALCGTRPRAVPSHGDRVLPLGVQYPAPLALGVQYPAPLALGVQYLGTGTGGSCSTVALGGVASTCASSRSPVLQRRKATHWLSPWMLRPFPLILRPFPLTPDRPYDDFDLRPSILA
jgi:hypothetical protein